MKINAKFIQRCASVLVFVTGMVFAVLSILDVPVMVNQEDITNIIFGLAAIVAAGIEVVPMLYALMKDKKTMELLLIVKDIVYAVEELKGLSGPEKKQKAIDSVREVCETRGVEFDEERVSDMIESAVSIYNLVIKDKRLLK